MANLISSTRIDAPDEHSHATSVTVLFYDDGTIRVRLPEFGPAALTEAFLSGRGKNVILKIKPLWEN